MFKEQEAHTFTKFNGFKGCKNKLLINIKIKFSNLFKHIIND